MVNTYPVIIVDDEFLAREELKSIIQNRHPDFEIIAEAKNIPDAWALIKKHPHIRGVFLDIHLQAENARAGLDFAYQLNRLADAPWIVIITSQPQTALEAHNLPPAHYLLKPLEEAKLAEALAWIRHKYARPIPNFSPVAKRIGIRHRILNRFGEHEWHIAYIDPEETLFVAKNTAASTLKISLQQNQTLDGVSGTIKEWVNKYADLGFVQIHRSHLVNLKHIRSLKPRIGESDVYKVALKDCAQELPVGPEYLEQLRDRLSQW